MRSKYFFLLFLLAGLHGFAQNNSIVLDGGYIILDGGTAATNIYVVVDQSSTSGIIRTTGGHISSEGQYNFVKWVSATNTGNFVFPFGVGGTAADYIPFTFNKTTGTGSNISMSTWRTNQQNVPHAAATNVGAVTNMIGVPDSVNNAIDRFWDIQASAAVTADLTFSYRGSENTTLIPANNFLGQHWNGSTWDPQAGPGSAGVITGIGTVGPIPGQTTFSPWILTRAGLNASVTSFQNVQCNGQCTGTATVTPTGGPTPYAYAWQGGQTTSIATGLCAGNYSVVVTDNSGASVTTTVTISQPAALSVSVTPTNVLCNSQCNGSAVINSAGGTPGYTYLWNSSPVQTSAMASGLCAASYSCMVTDANGCTASQSVSIAQPAILTATASATAATCGNANGTATAGGSGGAGGYSYSWTPSSQTNQTITGLAAGNYTATITDVNGCTATQTVSITNSNGPAAVLSQTNNLCHGDCSGTAQATVTGGNPFYTYAWSNGQSTSVATGLCAGSYTVVVTDNSGCTDVHVTTITEPAAMSVAAAANTGTITIGSSVSLSATGGGTYQWTPATGLDCSTCANAVSTPTESITYCVLVTDTNGCADSSCITITVDVPCGVFYVPNAFSPNGDGENDTHCVFGNCMASMHITIFDRWGVKMFESSDQAFCWDGKYKGKAQDPAVYAYFVEATFTTGKSINQKGNISLIR